MTAFLFFKSTILFFLIFIYVFLLFIWLHRVLVATCGALSLQHAGSLLLQPRVGSLAAAHGLSCPRTCGIPIPRPGIKPRSPTLEGGFLTTGSPGKSLKSIILKGSSNQGKGKSGLRTPCKHPFSGCMTGGAGFSVLTTRMRVTLPSGPGESWTASSHQSLHGLKAIPSLCCPQSSHSSLLLSSTFKKLWNVIFPQRMTSDFAFFYEHPDQGNTHSTHLLVLFFVNSKGKVNLLLTSMC